MSKTLKALDMTTSSEEQIKFECLTTDHLSGETVKTNKTTYDSFQEGSKENRFDFVVAPIFNEEVTADDVEMMEEYYQHYAKAPIFIWVIYKVDDGLADLKKFLKTTVPHSEVVIYEK